MAKFQKTITIEVDAPSAITAERRIEALLSGARDGAIAYEWAGPPVVLCDGETLDAYGPFGDHASLDSPEMAARNRIALAGGAGVAAKALGYHIFASMGSHYFRRGGPPIFGDLSCRGWSQGYDTPEDAADAAVLHAEMRERAEAAGGEGFNARKAFAQSQGFEVTQGQGMFGETYTLRRDGKPQNPTDARTSTQAWEDAFSASIAFEQRVREGRHAR